MTKTKDFFEKEIKENLGTKEPEDTTKEEPKKEPEQEEPEGQGLPTEPTQEPSKEPKGEEPEEPSEPEGGEPEEPSEPEEPKEENPVEKFDEFAKDMGYENMEAFINSTAAEKIKNFDGIKSEYDKAKKENEELYNSYEETQNPFVDERVYKINKLLSENESLGIDIASKIASGDFENMSNYELIKIQEKMESPELTDKLIKRNIERKYGIDDWDDIDEDTKDYMEIDARKARGKLSKMSDIEVPEKIVPDNVREKIKQKEEEANRSLEEVQEEWNPITEKIDDAFKEMPIPIEQKGKTDVISNYVFSDKDRQNIKSQVNDIIKTQKIRPTKENIEKINDMVFRNMAFDRLPKIVGIAVDKAVNDYKKSQSKQKYNPSQPKGKSTDKVAGKKPLSDITQKLNELKK